MLDRDPVLHPTPIADLRPTQMTVGLIEVERKRAEYVARTAADDAAFLSHHLIPAVLGPKRRPWIIDNHHLALALHRAGQKSVLLLIAADLSHLSRRMFLTVMDNRNWLHPFDVHGHRRPVDDLPRSLEKLTDDPYRSLAGALRRAGGYAKVEVPFAEFLWADFLRRRVKPDLLARDFDAALARALKLARHADATYLPGWAGPHD